MVREDLVYDHLMSMRFFTLKINEVFNIQASKIIYEANGYVYSWFQFANHCVQIAICFIISYKKWVQREESIQKHMSLIGADLVYGHLMSTRLFTLKINEVFIIWAPKITKEMAMATNDLNLLIIVLKLRFFNDMYPTRSGVERKSIQKNTRCTTTLTKWAMCT